MRTLTKALVTGLILGTAAVGSTSPARAQVSFSVGFGFPGYYNDYDWNHPCWWYRQYDMPAPRRCYSYFYGIWGPRIYADGDFIFRDHDDYWRWHDRDWYRHWRSHDFHWHGHGDVRAWDRDHRYWDRRDFHGEDHHDGHHDHDHHDDHHH